MVYCDYKRHTKDTVTYSYGGHPSDMTGVIVFDINGGGFEILNEPRGGEVYLRSINRLYNKYKEEFSRGKFKEKISYES